MIIQLPDLHLSGIDFLVTRRDGNLVDFSQLVTAYTWSDHVNTAAAEAVIEAEGSVANILQIGWEGSTGLVRAPLPDLASGRIAMREMWRGFFEEIDDERTVTGMQRTITAYDIGKLLATHEEDYVLRGETLSGIVRRICSDFSIPMGLITETSKSMGDIICRGESLWEGVLQKAIQRHFDLTGVVMRVRFVEGRLQLVPQGGSDRWWIFEVNRSLQRFRRVRSIADLENRVRIYGQVTEDIAKAKAESNIENTWSQDTYGLRQRVEYLAGAEDRQRVFDMAETRIKRNAIPTDTVEITGWAVPLLRAGEQVQVIDHELKLSQVYYVESAEVQWTNESSYSVATCKREPIDPEVFLDELVVA